jgi:5'(3')-deoxyribonucleotidase
LAPLIGFDVDGVLADFTGALLDRLAIRGHRFTHEDVKHWCLRTSLGEQAHEHVEPIVSAPGFCSAMPWIPGSHSLVASLRTMGADLVCVTSPWHSATWIPERLRWLSPLFKAEDVLFVKTRRKKHVALDVLVEDHPGTLAGWLEAHPKGLGILVDRPWNRLGSLEFADHPRMTRVHSTAEALHEIATRL